MAGHYNGVRLVWGIASLDVLDATPSETLAAGLSLLATHGHHEVDTARIYGAASHQWWHCHSLHH